MRISHTISDPSVYSSNFLSEWIKGFVIPASSNTVTLFKPLRIVALLSNLKANYQRLVDPDAKNKISNYGEVVTHKSTYRESINRVEFKNSELSGIRRESPCATQNIDE